MKPELKKNQIWESRSGKQYVIVGFYQQSVILRRLDEYGLSGTEAVASVTKVKAMKFVGLRSGRPAKVTGDAIFAAETLMSGKAPAKEFRL